MKLGLRAVSIYRPLFAEAPPQWWRFSAWRHVDELCRLRAFVIAFDALENNIRSPCLVIFGAAPLGECVYAKAKSRAIRVL